jgi:16S rRNA processing protein RimM
VPPARKPGLPPASELRPAALLPGKGLAVVGRIAAAFGVRGWVKVQLFGPEASALLDEPHWHLKRPNETEFREVKALEAAPHGKGLIAQLEGMTERDAAEAAVGTQIAIPRAALPARAEGEYYWAELTGLAVINRGREMLGQVTGLMETGAHDVLVVKDGDTERLLPMVAAVIDKVDLDAGEIHVDWGRDW